MKWLARLTSALRRLLRRLVQRKQPLRRWRVTLRTGEVIEVDAINSYHAGSLVVYGPSPHRIDGDTGRALNPVNIHRDNISDIQAIVPDPTTGETLLRSESSRPATKD